MYDAVVTETLREGWPNITKEQRGDTAENDTRFTACPSLGRLVQCQRTLLKQFEMEES
jgi:hypothetical protein